MINTLTKEDMLNAQRVFHFAYLNNLPTSALRDVNLNEQHFSLDVNTWLLEFTNTLLDNFNIDIESRPDTDYPQQTIHWASEEYVKDLALNTKILVIDEIIAPEDDFTTVFYTVEDEL